MMRSCGKTSEPGLGVVAAVKRLCPSTTANGPKWPLSSRLPIRQLPVHRVDVPAEIYSRMRGAR